MRDRVLLLLSTGIDSPVAGAILATKGFPLVTLSFLFSREQEDIVKKLASRLGDLAPGIEALVAPHPFTIDPGVTEIAGKRSCVLCKRLMYIVASRLAREKECSFLATGESVGQVASQTVQNLVAIQYGLGVDVLRPLVAFDKEEAIRKSRAYGLYELSIEDKISCPFVPRYPETRATPEMIDTLEMEVGRDRLSRLVDEVVSRTRTLSL